MSSRSALLAPTQPQEHGDTRTLESFAGRGSQLNASPLQLWFDSGSRQLSWVQVVRPFHWKALLWGKHLPFTTVPPACDCSPLVRLSPGWVLKVLTLVKTVRVCWQILELRAVPGKWNSFFPVSLLHSRCAQSSSGVPTSCVGPMHGDPYLTLLRTCQTPALSPPSRPSKGLWKLSDTAPVSGPSCMAPSLPRCWRQLPLLVPSRSGGGNSFSWLQVPTCCTIIRCFSTLLTPMSTVLPRPSLPLNPFTVASDLY